MADSGSWTYRDSGALGAWARALLYADAALCLAVSAATLAGGIDVADPAMLGALLQLAQLLLFLAAAIAFLCWLYRASANAHALGATDLIVKPGWSVGWFFVPLANLAMPYVAVRDLWKASARPRDWQAERAPAAIALWWALWLLTGISGAAGFRLASDYDPDMASAALGFVLASDLFEIPTALLLAWIVSGIVGLQRRAAPGGTDPAIFA